MEMLVRVVDSVNDKDPVQDAMCLKKGDVIAVCDDGHPWSKAELSNPNWRIIREPGVPRQEREHLLRPQMVRIEKLGMYVSVRPRAITVDPDAPALAGKLDAPADREGDYAKIEVTKTGLDEACKENLRSAQAVLDEIAKRAAELPVKEAEVVKR